jgi:tetratricopeptide (TPR) repeat protein
VIAAAARAGAAWLLLVTGPAMAAIDLAALWDFARPEASEQRFREALASAQGDDALILQTQIARSHGLRRDFERAREILRSQQPLLAGAGPEARVRWQLEWGRSFASAAHPPDAVTPAARAEARRAFESALATARESRHDALAIDAIHMFAFLDTAPADQLRWGREALAVAIASDQTAGRRWEASIRNNIGYALHQLGQYEEALAEFRRALALREAAGQPGPVRVAHWMVAWTLRALRRDDEALAIQLRLEREGDAAGAPDPYVFEELEALYRQRGDAARAAHYAQRRQALAR